ncbi:DUF3486 family protein [Salmonella enterica]|nr:DUF3486 family protein [Salmonella enterica]
MEKKTSRKNKVELLPPEIKERLNELIRAGNLTQQEILDRLAQLIDEKGLPADAVPSRSGFNRYHKRMEEAGAKIMAARQTAEVWTAKLGSAPTTEVGKLLHQFVQSLAFETSLKMSESDKPVDPKSLNQLALVLQRLEAAAMATHKREREIRTAFAEEAANAVGDELRGQDGMSEELELRIRRILLGKA